MKRTFSNTQDCFHIFAQQSQDEGKAASVSFYNNKAFSYSQCIGNIQGDNIFLIDWNYSNTTAKHNSQLRRATSQYNQVFIKSPSDPMDESNIESFENKAKSIVESIARAKKPEIYFSQLAELRTCVLNYVDSLPKLPKPLVKRLRALLNENFINPTLIESVQERIKQNRIKESQRLEKSISDFRSFESNYINNSDYSYLRVNGENLETSKGVTIGLKKVIPFIILYKKYVETKEETILNHLINKHLDYYTINSVNDKFVTVGCHKISKDEILALA